MSTQSAGRELTPKTGDDDPRGHPKVNTGLIWLPVPVGPHTIMVGGTMRRLLVAGPTCAPTAILVSMHGSTSTPERQVCLSRMATLTEQGAVVAFPQGSVPSLVAFHGTRDRINPYYGGHTARWDESVLDASSAWARANGHPPEPARPEVTPSLTRLSYGPRDDPAR